MIHRIAVPLSLLLVGLLPAQDEATTLARLARHADLIVQARAVRATDPDPGIHRWELEVEAALRGTPTARLALREPAGRCCGRALHAVAAGSSYLLFLESTPAGLHVLGGERGMEPADPELFSHVRALLNADASSRVDLLAAALEHSHHRARRDAALALASEPELESAGPAARRRIAGAATRLLSNGDTALSGILTAAARLRLSEVATGLLPMYLDGGAGDLDGLLLRHLHALDAPGICRAIAQRLPEDPDAGLRAVRLLERVREPAARPPLLRLVREGAEDCRTEAAAALLRAGMSREDLGAAAPPGVLDRAERRAREPRFRVVRPGGGRDRR